MNRGVVVGVVTLAVALGAAGTGATAAPVASPHSRIDLGEDPSPTDIAVGEGFVWVSDGQLPRLWRIHPKSRVVDTLNFGGGTSNSAVAAGEGAVWVYGAVLKRVDPQSFKVSGKVKNPKDMSSVVGLAAGAGAVWMVDDYLQVFRVDPETLDVTMIPLRTAFPQSGVGFSAALAVTDDAVWVLDPDFRLLHRIDPVSNAVTTINIGAVEPEAEPYSVAATEGAVALIEQFPVFCPVDVATSTMSKCVRLRVGLDLSDVAGADGFFWVLEGRNVHKVDPTGLKVGKTSASAKGPPLNYVAVGLGAVWVIDGSHGGFYITKDAGVEKLKLPR